jgi:hypothetical protein
MSMDWSSHENHPVHACTPKLSSSRRTYADDTRNDPVTSSRSAPATNRRERRSVGSSLVSSQTETHVSATVPSVMNG